MGIAFYEFPPHHWLILRFWALLPLLAGLSKIAWHCSRLGMLGKNIVVRLRLGGNKRNKMKLTLFSGSTGPAPSEMSA